MSHSSQSLSTRNYSIREHLKAVNYDTCRFLEGLTDNIDNLTPEQLYDILDDSVDNLRGVSSLIEDEVATAQATVISSEKSLYQQIDVQTGYLIDIEKDVERVLKQFETASNGAIRLGERLTTAESERIKIAFAQDLMNYIEYFEGVECKGFSKQLKECIGVELKSKLPPDLRSKDWGEISNILANLRRILYDVATDDVKHAEENIRNLSEAVERELLEQFEDAVNTILDEPGVEKHVKHAQDLAQWLHLFRGGSALQKRFIFSVVEKRIPMAVGSFIPIPPAPSDMSPAKPSNAPTMYGRIMGRAPSSELSMTSNNTYDSFSLIDHLSELFVSVSDLCQEQFSIIRQVFPSQSVGKVTKMLVSRIFNDPAFGIQARVDSVLRPKPPAPSLSPADYLDALVTVREKLSALHLMLLEYCTDSISLDDDFEETKDGAFPSVHTIVQEPSGASGYMSVVQKQKEDQLEKENMEKRQKNEELQAFLEDQVAQVFQNYLRDYFQKELFLLRNRFGELMNQAFQDPTLLSKSTTDLLPRLKPEKVKNVGQLVSSIATPQFIPAVLNVSSETVGRMIHIGRDDAKKLPLCIKDVYLIVTSFLSDCVFIPWAKTIKLLADKLKNSRRQASLTPPDQEFIIAISSFHKGVKLFRSHFEAVFSKPLSVQPNALTVCQESRRQTTKSIEVFIQGAMQSWISCLVNYYERVLISVQSRHDFAPKFDSGNGGIEPTTACRKVCQHLVDLINNATEKLRSEFKLTEVLWKPLGRQFAAVLISHIKRHKVSEEGAFVLVRDMDEYHNAFVVMDCQDARDLILCLREIVYIFMTPAENVVKMVSEDLRHLNTHVVLSLLKSRVDYGPKAEWYTPLSEIFAAIKWDTPLPWEGKNASTGKESFSNNSERIGPHSLRKVSGSKSSSASAHTPGSKTRQTYVSRALAPSAEQMMSTDVVGSSASRYAAVKGRRESYFINSTHTQSHSPPRPTKQASSHSQGGTGGAMNSGPQRIQKIPSFDLSGVTSRVIEGGNKIIGRSSSTSSDGDEVSPPKGKSSFTRRNSPQMKVSPSTASAKSTMFGKMSSAVSRFKSKNRTDRQTFS
mmetsp:Transcript_12211/g.18463  ORF Transcript_12211/g.18463 Transcript_12211/m.18463 type:complete len:1084 (+) Transcript_12211:93-3344(+)|eukprot:CAMPEP_0185033396 /NCGR_PEP_ID=MMETSP1103-20130426/22297_1 /TAXON_ID=36769 /ORGANISM="Paraphysomonas bandaiensis, Strain Caron Lab Isolate" /LENGTH=1083 /DNA_ID=CAMNT_0027569645 /DNA_START=17 /DNA_END=3268 /DNA_ORIENTATION=+